ncbi:MAG: FtsW/RodA/SpoVE family cell cycle protein [Candidatus Babeliales bacterium]
MLMFDRRYFRYFDWLSFAITIALVSIGLMFVFSATYRPDRPLSLFFKKQLFGALAGFVIYFLFCALEVRRLSRFALGGYFFTIVLLVYSIVSGWIAKGATRWVSLYFFRFQPSELIKLFLPAFIASYFSELETPKYYAYPPIPFTDFLIPLAVLSCSCLLIAKQPDLGTALLALFTGLILLWFVGIPRSFFLVLGMMCLIGTPILWKCLKPYQQTRFLVLMGYGEARKERYQIEQSKIAIGSGGIIGKGFLKGTQNKLDFLPEDHTDCIFSVVCEEWGFMGALMILMLYIILFARLVYIITHVPNFFEQIVGLGLMVHILLSVLINIGMVTGLLPIVGIPLPLFSYGLSNLWVTLASLGWLNNIAIRRFYY